MDEGIGNFSVNDQDWPFDEAGFGQVDQQTLLPTTSARAVVVNNVTVARGAKTLSLTRGILPESQQVGRTSQSLAVSHASPLAPLRARDRDALGDLFDEDDSAEMALDVYRYLSRTYPEPCWEDEPYEFLNGYI